MEYSGRVLYIDDDPLCRRVLTRTLSSEAYKVDAVDGLAGAVQLLRGSNYDAIIVDYLLPGITGLDVIEELHRIQPRAAYVLSTGHCTAGLAIEALNRHVVAYFLPKPWDGDQLTALLRQVTENDGLRHQASHPRRRASLQNLSLMFGFALLIVCSLLYMGQNALRRHQAEQNQQLVNSATALVSHLYEQPGHAPGVVAETLVRAFPTIVFCVIATGEGKVEQGYAESSVVQMSAQTPMTAVLQNLWELSDSEHDGLRIFTQRFAINENPAQSRLLKIGLSVNEQKQTRKILNAYAALGVFTVITLIVLGFFIGARGKKKIF